MESTRLSRKQETSLNALFVVVQKYFSSHDIRETSTDGKQTVPEMQLTTLTYVTIREIPENRKLCVTSGSRNTALNGGANNAISPNTYRNNTVI